MTPESGLPYYLKDGKKLTMPLAQEPSYVDQARLNYELKSIQRAVDLIRAIGLPPKVERLPFGSVKLPDIDLPIPKLQSAICRVDIVGGKIVDINFKPAGLGLTLAAEQVWGQPTKNIVPKDRKPVIVTESGYSFSSDQMRLAEIMNAQLIYCDKEEPDESWNQTFGLLCFSFLNSVNIPPSWKKLLLEKPDIFLLNPLVATYDNKSIMALPFLENYLSAGDIRRALVKARKVFPPTYLISATKKGLSMATRISDVGISYEPLGKFNNPFSGKGLCYLKPLSESGSRGIVIKNFSDWGTSLQILDKYSGRYPQFIVQESSKPELQNGRYLKDGYFVSVSDSNVNLITIERMGSNSSEIIHGGSQTQLMPVIIKDDKLE